MGAPDLDVESRVRQQLDQPYVYYLGSFMDCGCGFGYRAEGPMSKPQWSEERKQESVIWWEAFREATHQLAEYLENVTRDGPVTLFICWSGRATQPPQRRAQVTAEYFRGPQFHLYPTAGELISVVPG
jgi:hypothetical protein